MSTSFVDVKSRPHVKPRERHCSGDCRGYIDDLLSDNMLIPSSNCQVTLDKIKSSQDKKVHVLYVDIEEEGLKTFFEKKEDTPIFCKLNVSCQGGSISHTWSDPIYRLLLRGLLKLCSKMHESGLTFSSFDLEDIFFDGEMWKISAPCLVILPEDNGQRKTRINETFCTICRILEEAFGIDDTSDVVSSAGLKDFFLQLAKHDGDLIYNEYMICHYAILLDTQRIDFITEIFLNKDQVGSKWNICLKKVKIGVWWGFLQSKSYLLFPFDRMVDDDFNSNEYPGHDKKTIAKKLAKGTYNMLRLCKNALNHLVLNEYSGIPSFQRGEVLHMVEIQFLNYLLEVQWEFYQSEILHLVWMLFQKRTRKLFKDKRN